MGSVQKGFLILLASEVGTLQHGQHKMAYLQMPNGVGGHLCCRRQEERVLGNSCRGPGRFLRGGPQETNVL